MKTFTPYVFFDTDPNSHTYKLWCVRWTESMSIDGFMTEQDALNELKTLESEAAV
jgi:hypothetical protein